MRRQKLGHDVIMSHARKCRAALRHSLACGARFCGVPIPKHAERARIRLCYLYT